ncbi:Amino-acid permease inda1 [Epichloe bromicola]|uniref:Amino-acid permease inda1 n=1 Tax=Epichloe bromicola TaxID=79588 RepID=A0ABQ0CNG1_9HYPO
MDREGNIIAEYHRSGFETTIPLGIKYNYNHIRAAAISTSGENLAYTAIIDLENYIHLESNAITGAIHSTPVTFLVVKGPQLFPVVVALYVIYYLWKSSIRVRSEAPSKYKTELQGANAALANK